MLRQSSTEQRVLWARRRASKTGWGCSLVAACLPQHVQALSSTCNTEEPRTKQYQTQRWLINKNNEPQSDPNTSHVSESQEILGERRAGLLPSLAEPEEKLIILQTCLVGSSRSSPPTWMGIKCFKIAQRHRRS